MINKLYKPFETFNFDANTCFLSGATAEVKPIKILPDELLKIANLTGNEQIKLLDQSIRKYNDLTVPCGNTLYQQFIYPLDTEIENAFEQGYLAVKQLNELNLFKWIAKLIYGFIYIEMQAAIHQQQLHRDGANMSQAVMHKFGWLHTMLQAIHLNLIFENFSPWSILIVELDKIDTPFSFKDEINTLTFSLKFKNFGIIACLQDNGANKRYHDEILQAVAHKTITEQQFEELCARFYYSAYLFNRLPEYNVMCVNEAIFVEAMPLKGTQNKALFDAWQHKTYGQVLENFWKPWHHTLFEIIKDPNAPMSCFEPALLPKTQ